MFFFKNWLKLSDWWTQNGKKHQKLSQFPEGLHIFFNINSYVTLVVPTPLVGGRNYILEWVFFVQSILADGYIHRRELWVVSLKSSSSVEFEIKKILLNFLLFEELSRIEILCERDILFTFSVIYV